jgi:RND superfamily putative drug exporter
MYMYSCTVIEPASHSIGEAMLARTTNLTVRNPRRTALLALLLVLLAAAIGGPVASKLNARNAFEDPSSQLAKARTQIEHATGIEASAGVIALIHAAPSSPTVTAAAQTLRRDPAVARVDSYANTREEALVSKDGRSTLLAASLYSRAEPNATVDRLTKGFASNHDVQLGGPDVTMRQTNLQATKDLRFAELLAFPLLALLALLIFRGVAALLPLGVGVSSVLGSLAALRLINAGLPLSSFSLNVVIGLGLGLSIDYSLILVSRFREELGAGVEPTAAIATTMATAGRTVIFSSLTVAAAMASLIVFPLRFLQSIGIGGAVVALTAAATSLLLLPALFVLLGARLGAVKPAPAGRGVWYRLANGVMRRPGIIATATIAVLLALAVPTLHTRWSGVDASVLPSSQSAHVVAAAISREFPSENSAVVSRQAAQFHGQQAAIASSLPLGLAILALSTLVILWLMTGSVILPIKALAMNALTVGAALGLLVLVFQDGRFAGPLAYTSQGGIESTDFLVLAAIVFGLSTDYGVFLLTRIKEAHDRGMPNREAVAAGLQRTGRVVTAGAIMVAVALGAFATSHVVFIKELGLGTAAAVLIDAFVIRALLVPALMSLLEDWNWWSPKPLRRLHDWLDVAEEVRMRPATPSPQGVPAVAPQAG